MTWKNVLCRYAFSLVPFWQTFCEITKLFSYKLFSNGKTTNFPTSGLLLKIKKSLPGHTIFYRGMIEHTQFAMLVIHFLDY